MIKIKNKLFSRKKRQPNNENVKRLYNLFRNRVVNKELVKSKKITMPNTLKKIIIIVKKYGKEFDQLST